MTLIERFEDKIFYSPDGCWYWTASLTNIGYGQFKKNGTMMGAHRASHELYKGEIPEGVGVLHRCDNKLCVNPDHLFLGTQKENMDDMDKKGRGRFRGSQQGGAIFDETDVRVIRDAVAHGYTQRSVAKYFKVDFRLINMIVLRKNWKHVEA